MVVQDCGSDVANAIARRLVLYARRPGYQSQFSPLLDARIHAENPFAGLIDWMQNNLNRPLHVPALAARAGEEQRHQAAVSDPDAPPATESQLAHARRVPTVGALRAKLKLTQEEFAARFHLPLGTVRDWEQGAHRPDKAAQVLLRVIAKDPDAVARALEN